jgi:hypothetical protein
MGFREPQAKPLALHHLLVVAMDPHFRTTLSDSIMYSRTPTAKSPCFLMTQSLCQGRKVKCDRNFPCANCISALCLSSLMPDATRRHTISRMATSLESSDW